MIYNAENKQLDINRRVYAKYAKRILDIVISCIALIILSPVLLIICILIRIKLGKPILYKQRRTGMNEKSFDIIKFRTMTDQRDKNGELLPDTERFTKFGDLLRNSSLDELPELFNVLKGEMSLIGPRPLYPYYLPYYTVEESFRHSVRGGITGLSQINGRALLNWNERFALDIKYVQNITFMNDMAILIKTVYKVLKKEDVGIPSVNDEELLNIVRSVQRPEKMEKPEIGE